MNSACPSEESEVITFAREFTGVPAHRLITAETRLEAELGVIGDDGDDLLRAAIKRFRVDLASPEKGIAQTLQLAPNEYFFGTEGVDLLDISVLFGGLEVSRVRYIAIITEATFARGFCSRKELGSQVPIMTPGHE